ncbi:hypothetical protein Pryu01_02053 [Paraliobacillus ryukyuensis]|uniref:Uncharacterized protein n=1 Tax=Paraliobacillus ryukyuensis TaxID=200904 RepID=A0A366E6U8_9BACI|nr:hypothetical protein [Paraliobacillus ryukyuensis]RBO97214.1 hypothetical protein DES48_107133 [Paraliobacillus ryukyuensis]
MANQEEILDMRSNEWMATLERVKELRELLLEIQSGEILFWLHGEWHYQYKECNFPKGFITPHFILNPEILGNIDEKNVDNVILNILRLLDFYITYVNFHYDSGISYEDYLRQEINSGICTILHEKHDTLCDSYSFYVYNDRIAFNYTFSWNENGKGIHIFFYNSRYGYTSFYDLTMFLIEESRRIDDYELFTHFCRKIRKFQLHYYGNTSNADGDLYTSETEVQLLNPENRANRFDPSNDFYIVNCAVKIADIIDYFNLEIEVTDKKLLEKYIDTNYLYIQFGYYEFFNNITVREVQQIVIDTIEGKLQEPFSMRKYTCNYDNRFHFQVANEATKSECLVEWNYQEECYRFKKGENKYTYFESYTPLIFYILLDFKNESNFTWDKLVVDCVQLIKDIEKSSKVDMNLEYLIKRIKNPNVIENLLHGDDLPI